MPQRYTWLLFDADGTLFDYDQAEMHALERTFVQSAIAFQPAYLTAYREYNGQVWKALEAGQITPDVLRVRRFELLFDAIGVDAVPEAFSTAYLANLRDCSELVEGALELLRALHGTYRCAIATNGLADVQRPRVAGSALCDYIDILVISEEIGAAKPAAAYFDIVFERMGYPDKSQVLMIGDSLSSDIAGGSNYGLDTCWYNPTGLERPTDIAITYEIRDLAELPGILC